MEIRNKTLEYDNKIILAPMVRVGTLPMRLLALKYGADIVYTEEIIDWKLIRTTRQVNDVLGTVDFVDDDQTVVFRTTAAEKDKLVLQLGTSDPDRAFTVAKMVEKDVSGIDVNMGCPKEFSLKGGMGAALLTDVPRAKAILSALVNNLEIPVSCKIRVFENVEDTLNLVRELVSTGISAIAVHGRTKTERPQHSNRNYLIKTIAENVDIPVIANGGSREIEKHSDIKKFKKECGASSVMIARTAQANCSIFRSQGLIHLDQVITEYLKLAVDYDNLAFNTKYCIQNMLKELQETPRGKKFLECQTSEQICAIWNLQDYCRRKQLEYYEKGHVWRGPSKEQSEPDAKRLRLANNDESENVENQTADEIANEDANENGNETVNELHCVFIRSNYKEDYKLPKSILMLWCSQNNIEKPTYKIIVKGRYFRAVLTVDNKKYTSTYWEKSKRFAEQSAALSCIYHLGLVTKQELINNRSIYK